MSRVLVTGAGGFVGTTLVPALLQKGYFVRALDRFFYGPCRLVPHERLEIVYDDARRISPDYFRDIDIVVDLVSLSNDALGEYFDKATWEINHLARKRSARLAKGAGVGRYILASSCSIYGFQETDEPSRESGPTNPQTTYARCAELSEQDILPLADKNFCAVALRQATLYGYSPRMRFDLVVNAMTNSAWERGIIEVRRDGTQWRPLLHVKDDVRAIMMMMETDTDIINGEVYNVGSNRENYQLMDIAKTIASVSPREVEIKWYLEPDNRTYRVAFDKIKQLGYETEMNVAAGAKELFDLLSSGQVMKVDNTISLEYLKSLQVQHTFVKSLEMYGGMVDLPPGAMPDD